MSINLSKNLGISGASLIIVNKQLFKNIPIYPNTPIVMDWNIFYNNTTPTPSIFSIYLTLLNIKLMNNKGGIIYYHNLNYLRIPRRV